MCWTTRTQKKIQAHSPPLLLWQAVQGLREDGGLFAGRDLRGYAAIGWRLGHAAVLAQTACAAFGDTKQVRPALPSGHVRP